MHPAFNSVKKWIYAQIPKLLSGSFSLFGFLTNGTGST